MKKRNPTNLPASIHQRLMNLARATGRPFNELLQHYAIERFLFRLGRSRHASAFVLKGALMLRAWESPLARPTRDIDLLGRTENAVENVVATIQECLVTEVPEDGLSFDPGKVRGESIILDAKYQGIRIGAEGRLGQARVSLQVDVGFGDAIVPGPVTIEYPELLDFGRPRLLGYTPESAVAEKFQAMVELELANTRMKDFYDIWSLARRRPFDGEILAQAIRSTFVRRGTPLPEEPPPALTAAFSESKTKQSQWKAFLRKGRLENDAATLGEVVAVLSDFLMPLATALAAGDPFRMVWPPPGPWQARDPLPTGLDQKAG